jgi:hypothetical protein
MCSSTPGVRRAKRGAVEGVDQIVEMTGDFAMTTVRVMPHAAEPERLEKNLAAMKEVKSVTLSDHLGQPPKPIEEAPFPAFQPTDADIYQNRSPNDNSDRDLTRINLATSMFAGMWPGKVIVSPARQRSGRKSESPRR